MALIANWPIGMAPGMGLNAFFAFTVVKTMGYTWEQALGAVFISGVIFLFLTFGHPRLADQGHPAFAAQRHRRRHRTVPGHHRAQQRRHRGRPSGDQGHAGQPHQPRPAVRHPGLHHRVAGSRCVRGAILIGILVVTLLSMALGYNEFKGVFSAPPSLAPTLFAGHPGRAAFGLRARDPGVRAGRGVRRHRHAGGRGQARRPGAGRPPQPPGPRAARRQLGHRRRLDAGHQQHHRLCGKRARACRPAAAPA